MTIENQPADLGCVVSNGSGIMSNATPSSSPPSWSPRGISFGAVNGTQYAYVADISGEHLYRCTLNVNGTFNTCTITTPSSGETPDWRPRGVTVELVPS